MISLCVLPCTLPVVLTSSATAAINFFLFCCAYHHPIRIGDERERLVTALPVMTKRRGLGEAVTWRAPS
jgi:hypothetical protein